MKVGAIIQARLSSSRLPKKVLMQLPYKSGITVIEQVYNRVNKAHNVNEVILATSTEDSDKELIEFAKSKGFNVFAGSLDNVLERYYHAATNYNLDQIVRITGDCPCIDPQTIDLVIEEHLKSGADFSNISLKRTFPHGLDTAVFGYQQLKEAYENAQFEYEKQHVTAYFYKTHPEKFKIQLVEAKDKFNRPDIRITLDTKEDYALLCSVFDNFYPQRPDFKLEDIIELFNNKPWLLDINKNVIQKRPHANLQEEINEVLEYCEKQDLERAKEVLIRFKN